MGELDSPFDKVFKVKNCIVYTLSFMQQGNLNVQSPENRDFSVFLKSYRLSEHTVVSKIGQSA